MLRWLVFTVTMVIIFKPLHGQTLESLPIAEPDFQVFSYPLLLNGEEHKNFKLDFLLDEDSILELQGFYDTYALTNRLRGSITFKQYLSKKFYGIVGAEVEQQVGTGFLLSHGLTRYSLTGGIGYDFKDSFSLELRSNFAPNKNAMGAFGEPFIPMPQVHVLKGKVKF